MAAVGSLVRQQWRNVKNSRLVTIFRIKELRQKILITLLVVGIALPLLPGAVTTLVTEGVTDGLHLVGLG